MGEESELKTFNSAQGIAKERDLKLMLWHTYAMRQVLTGDVEGKENEPISSNNRIINQSEGLKEIISAQQQLISTFSSQIRFGSFQKWKKSRNAEGKEAEIPFEDFDCDYNKFKKIKETLILCRMAIIDAERTKRLDDDYIWEKIDDEGNTKYELTKNFYEMVNVLEETWEEIQLLLLLNKCISAGVEENEEMSYKEQEKEMKNRIENA